ncbi:MAG: hypothetical protein Q9171_004837 [Xanthocarpia ochracea]
MTEVPADRFTIDSFYHQNAQRLDTLNVRGGHFLKDDPAQFDAPFFSISSTEAASLDPQQRGLLEGTYEALENSGFSQIRNFDVAKDGAKYNPRYRLFKQPQRTPFGFFELAQSGIEHEAQEALIRDTYRSAGLDPQTTRFFEAHGTGTPVGDPIEAAAIAAVFKDLRTSEEPLLIGAVKSNIGHLEGASGLASLIKTVMVLEKGVIPPNIWFERPHPEIHAEDWNIKFPLSVTASPTSGLRRASVNSFGYGGANAHVVLDDARHYMESHGLDGRHATSESQVELAQPLQQTHNAELGLWQILALVDLLTSWGIRSAAVVGHSSGEIAAAHCAGAISEKSAWKLAYLRGLLASRLARLSSGHRGSMVAVALSEEAIVPSKQNAITVACINSPLNTTVSGNEDAIIDLQKVLDQEHIFARRLPVGVAYHSAQMNDVAADYLSLIGDLDPPQDYHSSKKQTPMYSSVTGLPVSTENLLRAEYWVDNMRSKVRFSDALSRMCSPDNKEGQSQHTSTVSFMVEIGPHSMMRQPIAETVGKVGYISALRKKTSAADTILHLAAELYCLDCAIDLLAVNNIATVKEAEMLVDLPSYPFNHSQSYWHESRISKNFRFRQHPMHELLGTPISTSNSLEAEWKNIIRVTESPWIEDHKFNGSNLYPAAGIVVMAIEAARQMASPAGTRPIKGYRLTNVNFLKAVRGSTTAEGIQTQFYLHPHRSGGTTASHRSEFRLYMVSNDEWIENCHGIITTEYDEDEVEVDRGFESRHRLTQQRDAFARGVRRCDKEVDSLQMYSNLNQFGFGFGPTFQTLEQVYYDDEGEATATINLHAWKERVPAENRAIQRHVIHPTALDGVFHLTLTAITRGGWVSIPTMAEFDVVALDPGTKEPMIILDSYRATAVTSLDESSSGESRWRRLCYSIDTRSDLGLLDKDSLAAYCSKSVDTAHVDAEDLIDDVELACLYFMTKASVAVRYKENPNLSSHLRSYISWMQQHCNRRDAKTILSSPERQRFCNEPTYRDAKLRKLQQSGPEGKVYVTIGRYLIRILSGLLDPLELLLNQELLQSFYSGSSFTAKYQRMAAFVDLSAHKTPNQSILEIGAGTGAATRLILDILGPKVPNDKRGTPRYEQYTYTDISPGFFQDARKRFDDHLDRLVFKTLDIEKDPLWQGLDGEAYDLIIASCVLHATTEIKTTLHNTRELLKPGQVEVKVKAVGVNFKNFMVALGQLPDKSLGQECAGTVTRVGPGVDPTKLQEKEATDVSIRYPRRPYTIKSESVIRQGIMRLTNNKGVDVVLNSLAGKSLQASFECVAPLGRFIEIGKQDIYSGETLSMAPFLKGVMFSSVDLGVVAEQAQPLMATLMEAVISLATESTIKPPQPLNVFRVSEVESAFRFLQRGTNAGKTIIEIH